VTVVRQDRAGAGAARNAGAAAAAGDLRAAGSDLLMQAKEHCKCHSPGEEFPPQLIEGHLEGCVVDVPMPNGETWRYALAECWAAPCPVLVCVVSPATAHVFRPSAEGVHPFLRTVRRLGVDQPKEGGAA